MRENTMFAKRHPIWAKIEDGRLFIATLLDFFVRQERLYINEKTEQIRRVAQQTSDGDDEMRTFIETQLMTIFYNNQDNQNIFYQSMLVMSYSYYEICANLIGRNLTNIKQGQQDMITSICENTNIALPAHIVKEKKFLYEDIREIRNYIVHNNAIPPKDKQADAINRLIGRYPEIKFKNNAVAIMGPNCILDILSKEYFVLEYLCKALGLC